MHADPWNCPGEQVEHATQLFPARWYPGAQVVQVVASLQAEQPAGHVEQAVSVVGVQAAVWY